MVWVEFVSTPNTLVDMTSKGGRSAERVCGEHCIVYMYSVHMHVHVYTYMYMYLLYMHGRSNLIACLYVFYNIGQPLNFVEP